MLRISERESDIWEKILQRLSEQAFDYILEKGIRDISSFLTFVPEYENSIPNKMINELHERQEYGKKILREMTILTEDSSSEINSDDHKLVSGKKLQKTGRKLSRPFRGLWGISPETKTAGDFEPASWSILNRTFPEIYGIDEIGRNLLFDEMGNVSLRKLDLDSQKWIENRNLAISIDDNFEILLSSTIGRILNLVSRQLFDDLMFNFPRVLDKFTSSGILKPQLSIASAESIFKDSDVNGLENFHIHLLECFSPPAILVETFNIRTWSDITKISEKDIIDNLGINHVSLSLIKDIWRLRFTIREELNTKPGLSDDRYKSFDEMMHFFTKESLHNTKNQFIINARFGLIMPNNKLTYDEIGDHFKLTRERIRQRYKKSTTRLKCNLKIIDLFYSVISDLFNVFGGACKIDELGYAIAERFNWQAKPSILPLRSLLALKDDWHYDMDIDVVIDKRNHCTECNIPYEYIELLFSHDLKRKIPVHTLSEGIASECSKACEFNRGKLQFSTGFIYNCLKNAEHICLDEDIVYSSNAWSVKMGTRLQIVEDIMLEEQRVMHYKDVCKALQSIYPNDLNVNNNNVHSWLDRNENIFLWDRGTFIHKDHVNIPYSLINEINIFIIDKLRSREVPLISIVGVYNIFKEQLLESEVLSPTALYSCLRLLNNDELSFQKYPYARLSESPSEILPLTIILEQYLLDAGGVISRDEINDYIINDLFINPQLLEIHFHNIPNIMRSGSRTYIHRDNLPFSLKDALPLFEYTKKKLSNVGHVSVKSIFYDKRVSCLSLGIDNPIYLYSILESIADDSMTLRKYPTIISGQFAEENISVSSMIEKHIFDCNRPCTYDEIEEKFVKQLRYSYATVRNIMQRDNIIRYGQGSVVHIDNLDWNSEKQQILAEIALRACLDSKEIGRCYTLVSTLMENHGHELPELANNIIWTQTLLSDLLAYCGKFKVLGSCRDAFVELPNEMKIEKFEDLIYIILKNEYNGAVVLEQFEEDMRKARIVKNRIAPRMLGDQERVCIEENVIMLTEYSNHA